jgi:hypothetical protein
MKLKDHLEQNNTPEALRARMRAHKVKSIVEYYLDSMTLREALTTLDDMLYKQFDSLPQAVIESKYNDIFER